MDDGLSVGEFIVDYHENAALKYRIGDGAYFVCRVGDTLPPVRFDGYLAALTEFEGLRAA